MTHTTVEPSDARESDDQPIQGHSWLSRLYTGTGVIDVIGRRRFYYALTAAIVALSLLSMGVKGFTFGIDFEGGAKVSLPASANLSNDQVTDVYSRTLGKDPVSVVTVGSGSSATVQLRSEALSGEDAAKLQKALYGASPALKAGDISMSDVSSTWGGEITKKALIALAVFLVLVTIYIAVRFERDMASAALAALAFDLIVTAGVYSAVGLEVTPATIIGMLTILGFSLYDSVVVFDKVEENTRGILHLTRRTYGEQANLAINQTLMRSINTTLIGVLPVIGLMVVAVWMLGVGTLKDLALVQLVGMIVGAYSSIFFATPLLVSLKERFGPVAAHTAKVMARRAGGKTDATAAATRYTVAPAPGARPSGKRSKRRH